MEDQTTKDRLDIFMETGIYWFENSKVVFIDPVRLLNRSYNRFRVSPSVYYSRYFDCVLEDKSSKLCSNSRKRRRKEQKPCLLNEKERAADQRHEEARPILFKAHECLLKDTDMLGILKSLNCDPGSLTECRDIALPLAQHSFIELGQVWQAPLYDITLKFRLNRTNDAGASPTKQCSERVLPVFGNLVANETADDVEAEFMSCHYVLPRDSCFYMSDLRQVRNLVPDGCDRGFNVIVIDPPWENGSARQKLKYPTLPNRYFLALPIKQISHTEGALVALWVTNREKLRGFVEKELFPAWGVRYLSTFYWLKVKADGMLISDLDLFHHRPYECLILGYCHGENSTYVECFEKTVPDNQIVISIPGDYSRKPPVGELLRELIPGLKSGRCIELFARELMSGWVSWGNEPLHFQESRFFTRR